MPATWTCVCGWTSCLLGNVTPAGSHESEEEPFPPQADIHHVGFRLSLSVSPCRTPGLVPTRSWGGQQAQHPLGAHSRPTSFLGCMLSQALGAPPLTGATRAFQSPEAWPGPGTSGESAKEGQSNAPLAAEPLPACLSPGPHVHPQAALCSHSSLGCAGLLWAVALRCVTKGLRPH